ncbi:MAG TPA: TonB-dependent receptor [Chthoniobacterales bacterium]|nr:TonB-dependent receptor [Chthoniobacterales bacterium]
MHRSCDVKLAAALWLMSGFSPFARAQDAASERVVVSAARLPDAESAAPFRVTALDAEELRRAPQLRLDDILRNEAPGFSLFRRNSSRTANPTTQGVTLRNFGPSGAGRTLVLLDGIPLNDPFAGYVLWSQVPAAGIGSVIVQPGSGAGLFGNSALAGTIFLGSKPIETSSISILGLAGNADTYEAAVDGALKRGPLGFALLVDRFSTVGYPVIAPNQRGPVDVNASADSTLFDLRATWQADAETSLSARARWFEDDRGNGTPFTKNRTEGADFSASFAKKLPAESAELQVSAYGQRRKFSSTFSSVNATRTAETPALDQFDVPADAGGGSVVYGGVAGPHHFVFGADARWVDGETNENFSWNGTTFTRLREAGGEQFFAGIFGEDTWSLSNAATLVAGVRLDHWELNDGFRREIDRATGAVRVNSHFENRDGEEINGRIGLRVKPSDNLALRGAFFSGFRVPTLNELYRPFRVGNDVTEANPALNPEHLLGAEAGFEWEATKTFRVSATGFVNRLEDAVSNVTIGFGPGTFDPGGFIPAGGVLRQRRNIDLVVAPGVEANAEWQIVPALRAKAAYLFTRPTIERAADHTLVGNLLAQTPEHVVTAGLEWDPTPKWRFGIQARHSSRQFEDDQNSRSLAPFTVCDLMAGYEFNDHVSAALRVENVFDTQIETGRSADGLISIGAPRLVTLQMRVGL